MSFKVQISDFTSRKHTDVQISLPRRETLKDCRTIHPRLEGAFCFVFVLEPYVALGQEFVNVRGSLTQLAYEPAIYNMLVRVFVFSRFFCWCA